MTLTIQSLKYTKSLLQEIVSSDTEEELIDLINRRPNALIYYGDEVAQAWIRVRTNRFTPNRFCVLKPNPTSRASRVNSDPSACRELQAQAKEWIKRVASGFHGHGLKRVECRDWFSFTGALETKDENNRPVPPHYHVAIAVPEEHLPWFDGPKGGRYRWNLITRSNDPDIYHCREPRHASDRNAAVAYDTDPLRNVEAWDYLLTPALLS